eukprot:Amastigsp_a342597_31.p4 type:complete len:146 gc:universal Amastigsp_a342597_31:117-554(+)
MPTAARWSSSDPRDRRGSRLEPRARCRTAASCYCARGRGRSQARTRRRSRDFGAVFPSSTPRHRSRRGGARRKEDRRSESWRCPGFRPRRSGGAQQSQGPPCARPRHTRCRRATPRDAAACPTRGDGLASPGCCARGRRAGSCLC